MSGSPLIELDLSGIDALHGAVAGRAPEQCGARPGPGAWSIEDAVDHLAHHLEFIRRKREALG